MLPVRCALLLILLVAAGCLQPGSKPEGHKLFSGRNIGGIGFVSLADETDPNTQVTWVSFNQRTAPAVPPKGAVSDLWLASWDGTQQRQVVQNLSSNWGLAGTGGSLFAMVDEQQVGSGAGQGEWVATLVRIDSYYHANLRFENLSTFTLGPSDSRLLYRKVPGGNETPGLFLWDEVQGEFRLGDLAQVYQFDAQIAGSGAVYFVMGSDQVLSRLGSPTGTKEDLHAHVNSFSLRYDEKYAALSLSTGTTVVLDLQSGKDIPLALPNPCGGLGFADPNLATYQQCAVAGAPAELHALDLTTGTDTFVTLPAPLVNLAGSPTPRPQSDETLYLDSQGHGVFVGQNDQKVRRVVPVPMLFPQFSSDGQYLLYVDQRPATQADPYPHGPLMVQDSDLVNPPRQLSTPGMTLEADRPSFFPIDAPSIDGGPSYSFVFWGYLVRGDYDLYFANHETGELKVVARSIGNVSVDSQRIFGTVNESAQDLVGDLVVQDVRDSGGRTLAHAVGEATAWSEPNTQKTLVGYVVRGRVASDHDGLWGTFMDLPGQDGGH
jgi:hypothetical protein